MTIIDAVTLAALLYAAVCAAVFVAVSLVSTGGGIRSLGGGVALSLLWPVTLWLALRGDNR